MILVLAAASSVACAGYGSILKKWTKTGRSFNPDTLDARLIFTATILSDDIISAQKDVVEDRKMDNIDVPASSGNDFFISFFAHKWLADLSNESNSTWKMFLVGANGVEIAPQKIEPVTITPVEAVFYPYLNRWSKAYHVSFPRTELGRHPQLILRSIVTESVAKWNLK